MKNSKQEILTGNLFKGILWYSLPLCLSNVLQVLFNISDVAIVGKFAGSNALGSVGSCTLLVNLFTTFMIGLSNGMSIITAHYRGAKEDRNVSKAVFNAFVIALVLGIVLFFVGFTFAKQFLLLINTKEDLLEGALIYLRIYFLGIPATMFYNFGASVYMAIGDTKKPLYILLISGLINIGLNLLTVIGFHMETAGVAIASMVSQYVSCIIIMILLFKEKECYKLTIRKELWDKQFIVSLLRIGIPTGLQNAIFAIANLFIQSAVNSFDTIVVKGNSAAMNADNLVYDVMAAFYAGCASYISQNFGARNKQRILKSYFIALGYSFSIGLAMGLTLYVFGNEFLSLFTSEIDVINAGMERLKIMSISYGFSAFMDCTIAASRGLGKSTIPTIIVFLGSCVFRIVWIYTVVAYYHTITSIYLLYICSWSITALFEVLYFIPLYKNKMVELEYYD